jgi:hypothetical protein
MVWFNGDRPGIDRLPTGIMYSTALTSAPRVIREAVAAPAPRGAAVTPTAAPPPDQVVATPRPARSWAAPTEAPPSWLERAMARTNFPVAAAMAAVAGLLAVVAVVRVAAAGARGG